MMTEKQRIAVLVKARIREAQNEIFELVEHHLPERLKPSGTAIRKIISIAYVRGMQHGIALRKIGATE